MNEPIQTRIDWSRAGRVTGLVAIINKQMNFSKTFVS